MELIGQPFPSLPEHRVQAARLADGREVVVKRGSDLELEARVLLRCQHATPRLLSHSKTELVLERAGQDLTGQPDDEATRIAAALMQRFWTPPLEGFPTLLDWSGGFQGQDRARAVYLELAHSQKPPVLLHGDLHHDNILESERGWLAIDPQGVIGEPAYEVGAFMRNPRARVLEMPSRAIERRLDIFAESLGEERLRLKLWSYSQAVLAACWSLEDGDREDAEGWLACAQKLWDA